MSFDRLVDHSVIADANARLDAATARLDLAEKNLAAAQTAHKAAVATSDRAVRGDSEIDAMQAEVALEGSARSLSVARKIRDAASQAHHDARTGIATAEALAHAPLALAGIRARVTASKKADAAKAMLAEAEREFSDATFATKQAMAHGVGLHPNIPHQIDKPIRTEASERAMWADASIDFDRGTWGWLAQYKKEVA